MRIHPVVIHPSPVVSLATGSHLASTLLTREQSLLSTRLGWGDLSFSLETAASLTKETPSRQLASPVCVVHSCGGTVDLEHRSPLSVPLLWKDRS